VRFNEAKKIEDFIKRAEKEINNFSDIAGVEAVNFYTRNFTKQGFDDNGVEHWKGRKRERKRDSGRAILVKSGALRRSLLKRKAGKLSVFIISPLAYANRHNEGLKGMPKRQFVGNSRKLNKKILFKLDRRIQFAQR
jgi:phage gpG-like protein